MINEIYCIVAGYILLKKTRRQEWMSKQLLPEDIFSISEGVCYRFPSTYAFDWMSYSDEERAEYFEGLGIDSDSLKRITEWTTSNYQKKVAWPGVFYNLDCAKFAKEKFFSATEGIEIIEISIPSSLVDSVIEFAIPKNKNSALYPMVKDGWVGILNNKQISSNELLGYELLNIESGVLSESWLDNGLETHFAKSNGVIPNQFGLIRNVDDARTCSELVNKKKVPAEAGLWVPVGLHLCS